MKLSIIIPVYNSEQYIGRCLNSILNQNLPLDDYEVIIINDGSSDNSLQIANVFAKQYKNVKVYGQSNKGQGVARNKGMEKALGDYIMFIDSDDYLVHNVLNDMLSRVEDNNVEILVSGFWQMSRDGSIQQRIDRFVEKNCLFSGEQVVLKGYFPTSVCAKLYHRRFVLDCNVTFASGIIHEDVDFNVRLFPKAKRVKFIDKCTYVYFWNPLSTDRFINEKKQRKSLLSDIHIAKSMSDVVHSGTISSEMCLLYKKHINSMIITPIINYLRNPHSVSKEIIKDYIMTARKEKFIPINGKTKSFRTSLLIPIINCNRVLDLLIRYR